MEITKNTTKRPYNKPAVIKIAMDNNISLYLISENTIPDPPWMSENKNTNTPYKTDKV